MRVRYIVAITGVLLIGFGVKLLASSPAANASLETTTGANMKMAQMPIDQFNTKNLPAQKVHDMSFVYSEGD